MASDPNAYLYAYENVGLFSDITNDRPAVLYAYENVGLVGQAWAVSYIRWVLDDRPAVLYAYENVQ